MKWTKEPPSEPGWYWWKCVGTNPVDMRVLLVNRTAVPHQVRAGLMVCTNMSHPWEGVCIIADQRWSGPIPEPEGEA